MVRIALGESAGVFSLGERLTPTSAESVQGLRPEDDRRPSPSGHICPSWRTPEASWSALPPPQQTAGHPSIQPS